MKKYFYSNISCFVNSILVILILMASSCSSNWKLAYLKNEEQRKVDAFTVGAKADDSQTLELNDNTDENNEDETSVFTDSTYVATSENEQVFSYMDAKGNIEATMYIEELVITDSRSSFTPVDTSGRLLMSLTVEIPKDIIDTDWQLRLHPTIFLRQKKVETINFPIEDLYITGSEYRDKQVMGYERYSNYLSKITSDKLAYNNTLNLNEVLDKNISDHVNKYQLEYFIMRNFPEIYSLKNDSTYISDEKFASVLGVEKDRVIRHYYNESAEKKLSKLRSEKKNQFNTLVYNPIDYSNIKGDNIVSCDTLQEFDKIYTDVLKQIKNDDSLSKIYFKYIDSVKSDKKLEYPELKSEYFMMLDNPEYAQEKGNDKNVKSDSKRKFFDFNFSDLRTKKFKLDKYNVISGNDTSKVYMKFDYSTALDAFQFPGLDKVYIGITGDVYNDTTLIHNFTMANRLEYPVVSTASLADTTEIIYDSIPQLRKANHGANYSIGFEQGKSALKESFGNNAQVIADIKTNLAALMKNAEFDLDSIIVSATASPEGSVVINEKLSKQRSQAVSQYFKSYIDSQRWKYKQREDSLKAVYNENIASARTAYEEGLIPKEDVDFIINKFEKELQAVKAPNIDFKDYPIAENWSDLQYLITTDSIISYDEKNMFYSAYEKYDNLDARETNMKKHSYYNYMKDKLYPKIRVVKFDFHMHRKGQEHDTIWIEVPSKKYLEGVQALRDFDFVKAENILKHYPSYNSAICFIVRKKPLQAINLLEDPKMYIDFEHFKIKRDSLTREYVAAAADSTLMHLKDTINCQIEVVKERMDRAAKIEFLKAKAYFMRRKGNEDLDKALKSYLFLIRMDKLNGLYSKMMTGEELKGGLVFGSNEYFTFTASTDEYLSGLPKLRIFNEKIKQYSEQLAFELWKERKKYFNATELEQYNILKEAYMYDDEGNIRSEEELEKVLMIEFM